MCDRKKALARKVMNECSPTVISGRMGDITALTMDVMDRGQLCVQLLHDLIV